MHLPSITLLLPLHCLIMARTACMLHCAKPCAAEPVTAIDHFPNRMMQAYPDVDLIEASVSLAGPEPKVTAWKEVRPLESSCTIPQNPLQSPGHLWLYLI